MKKNTPSIILALSIATVIVLGSLAAWPAIKEFFGLLAAALSGFFPH